MASTAATTLGDDRTMNNLAFLSTMAIVFVAATAYCGVTVWRGVRNLRADSADRHPRLSTVPDEKLRLALKLVSVLLVLGVAISTATVIALIGQL